MFCANINAVKMSGHINIHMLMQCYAECSKRSEELKIPINERVTPFHKQLNSSVKKLASAATSLVFLPKRLSKENNESALHPINNYNIGD